MIILKVCWYRTKHFNLTPALIVLPDGGTIIVQVKFLNRHAGVQFICP